MCRSIFLGLLVVGGLAACSEKPASSTLEPVETAGQAMRKDNEDIAKRLAEQKAAIALQDETNRKAREVAVIRSAATNLGGAIDTAALTGRSDLGPELDKVAAARQTLVDAETNSCTASVKSILLETADKSVAAIKLFQAEKGVASDTARAQFTQSSEAFGAAVASLQTCM
jgi:hypothetical protein